MRSVLENVLRDVGLIGVGGDVDDGRLTIYFDDGAGCADGENEIERGKVADFDGDIVALQFGEPRGLDHDGVRARWQVGEAVVAAAVGVEAFLASE